MVTYGMLLFSLYIFSLTFFVWPKKTNHTGCPPGSTITKTRENKNALVCGVELVPIFRDPGSPAENGFFNLKKLYVSEVIGYPNHHLRI